MADRVGQHFGNYRLVALLGEGGYAQVYLGQHVRLELQAAIKVLHSHLTISEAEHFQHEAQTIARLVHPAIVRIFDFDVQDGIPFLVMDYAAGGSLRQRYPKGNVVPLPLILSFVKQVASALQYAHDQHLIHRDVKPENMLVGRHEEVLLSDFGLVTLMPQSLSPQATEPMEQSLAGTMPYLAPEQLRGKARPASDQYALAVVVYEWLCGKPPFQGPFLEVAVQHVSVPPPSLCEQVPDLSPDIERVVLRALAKEPEQRFASVEDFALALEEACRPETSSRPSLPDLSSHRSSEARQASKHHLPAQLTPFIGREQEVAKACELLSRPAVRLLTLTGPGGIGKTRLSLQVAAKLSDHFIDGVYFVSLAPLSDPDLVVPTIAQVLDVKESATRPMLEQLQAFLQKKQVLLVLDNFEQVIAAAPSLSDLLTACPHLKLLVTSRHVLCLSAEHEFAVAPLSLPDLKHLPDLVTLSQYEAVALFIQRAQAARPDFQVSNATAPAVAEICTRLDGLPLAIELAAARTKLLPPQALLARLGQRMAVLTGGVRDMPARQQTLRDTIDWSYRLLDAGERQLFRRLSVFVGGCTLDAIEAVCNACGDDLLLVLDRVASLIDKSLLRQTEQEGEEPRLVMLETIREYGLACLATSGEFEVTRQAHAAYYLHLAEQEAEEFDGPRQAAVLECLTREYENLRAVQQWSLEQVAAEEYERRLTFGLRLAKALRAFWVMRGLLREGFDFLERTLTRGEGIISTSERARALDQLGNYARFLNDKDRAEALLKESLRLRRELTDARGIATTLLRLGTVAMDRCDFVVARSLTEEALALFSTQENQQRITWTLFQLAKIARHQGDYSQAYTLGKECLARNKTQGITEEVGNSLYFLAEVLFESQGDLETVHSLLEEAAVLFQEVGGISAFNLVLPGHVALQRGDVLTASMLAEKSLSLSREGDAADDLALALALQGRVNAIEGDLTVAHAFYEESLAIARQANLKGIMASGLEGLASVVVAQGETAWAARLWGAAETMREPIGAPLPPIYRADYERSVTAARVQLGEKAFAAAWAEGRGMTPDQAVAARGPVTIPSETQPTLPAKLPPSYPDGLTAREVEVLRLVAQGRSNAEIAEQLVISLLTVKAHMRSLYNKLGISSRSAATRYAIEHHLI